MKTSRVVVCPYCGENAEFVNGNRIYSTPGPWNRLWFWACFDCLAWVGCHKRNHQYGRKGDEPFGILANEELRNAKRHVHRLLDPLWQQKGISRKEAYRVLADAMGISKNDCHVGMFDLERCREAYRALMKVHRELQEEQNGNKV